jgi:hypothetical protein
MSNKFPLQPAGRRSLSRKPESHEVVDVEAREVVPLASREVASFAPREVAPPDTLPGFGGFSSFHYTRTEVTSQGGRTHVRSRSTRLQDGRLTSESFEGELDGRAHADAVRAAEREILEQAARLLNPLAWLLPWSRGRR